MAIYTSCVRDNFVKAGFKVQARNVLMIEMAGSEESSENL